jgi:hypothetical protein
MAIPWYMQDKRFDPGTVADVGHSLRLSLRKQKSRADEWRLYMAIRTSKDNGVSEDRLVRSVTVAVFKKCPSLKEAQSKAEIWFAAWRSDLF